MPQSLRNLKKESNLAIWAEEVQACRTSGLTVRQWCAEKGITPNTYFQHQKKVFAAAVREAGSFYEVSMPKAPERGAVSIQVNGVLAEIHAGADEETILAVLRAMKSC